MKRGFRQACVRVWLAVMAACALAPCVDGQTLQPSPQTQQTAARPPADPDKFAVILSGASGEEAYAKQFARWTADLRGSLVERLGFAESNLKILSENPADKTTTRATADEVRRAFEFLRGAMTEESTLFVFFIGHGSFDGKQSKFNLVGPDLHAGEYRDLIGALPARRSIIVNMSSASGEFVKALAGRGRIIVTATRSGQEQNAPRFAEHFVKSLTEREADADQNGRVSVLEAFDYAARLVAEYYKRAGRLATEHALLEDSGDGVGHERGEAGDGALARATYFDSMSVQQAAASAEVGRLLRERERLEVEIEAFKNRKTELPESDYWAGLEKMFVELAKVNRGIKKGGQ